MSRIVLDSGALIALERNDRALWAALKLAAFESTDVLVPSTALAQVWRGTPAQARLSKALQHCVIASFDAVARPVGELCGRTRTADICDAHVAIVAATRGDVLYTSDPEDMRRLVTACDRGSPTIVPC
ncbi:MAG: twitching motility protein PilT [Planctomycetes bacterium]|nr:twitching motility protein PilT [Planctomycetota bacterium]